MNAVEIIARKRDGAQLETGEIRFMIGGIVEGSIPDYQSAAWLMAIYLRGMDRRETLDLTLAMRDSGARIDLSDLPNGPAVDKHSTGGVGDKTSLVVVPILAAAGVPVLKMSGRGLGYSGGTVDKLESIPGFRTDLPVAEARRLVAEAGAVMLAQSAELAPADRVLYGLRDVTATIDAIPLIASSIMSKKLAAGGQRIVLDVKCGRGAFMKSRERAEELARELVSIGNGAGVPTSAIISAMDEPLGRAVGNALEVKEAIETMQRLPADPLFVDLCLELAGDALMAAGKAATAEEGRATAAELLRSRAALNRFVAMVKEQGGGGSAEAILGELPRAPVLAIVSAPSDGWISSIDAEAIGRLSVEMGAGRLVRDAEIDPSVGIVLHHKTGSRVRPGDALAELNMRSADKDRAFDWGERLTAAFAFADHPATAIRSLVLQRVTLG